MDLQNCLCHNWDLCLGPQLPKAIVTCTLHAKCKICHAQYYYYCNACALSCWKKVLREESPHTWTQEAYHPPCSEYSFCCPILADPPTWPPLVDRQIDGWMDGQTRVKTLPSHHTTYAGNKNGYRNWNENYLKVNLPMK